MFSCDFCEILKDIFLKKLLGRLFLAFISQGSTQGTDIPVKILKENVDIFLEYISLFFDESINRGRFPDIFKLAENTPDFKKGCRGSTENHQPSTSCRSFQEKSEKSLCKQLTLFIYKHLSKFNCGFRKGCSA